MRDKSKQFKDWLMLGKVVFLACGVVACNSGVNAPSTTAIPPEPDTPAQANPSDNQTLPSRTLSLQDCSNLNQQAMNACAYENYQAVDAELSAVYQQIEKALPEDGKQVLKAAELAWSKFRDLDCEFERSQFEGGSIAPFVYNSCLEAQTNSRIQELSESIAGGASYQAADSALNAAYQSLLETVDSSREAALVDAQLAWIEHRDRHCTFEASYGAIAIEEDQCKARLSEKRTRQIQNGIEQNNL